MSGGNRKSGIPGYRPDIDWLRALAVLAVVAYHAYPASFKGGFVGVDIFFVISGFLICGIILAALEKGTFTIRGFYQRRICRLFPALITVLLTVMAFGWFLLLPDEYASLGKHSAGGAGFIANLMIWQEVGYWDIAAKLKPLLHLWSLGIEEQFYIIFPCLLLIAYKKGIRLLTLIFVIFVISFACNMHYYLSDPSLDFYAPFTRFWELLAGAILSVAVRSNKPRLGRAVLALDYFLAQCCLSREIRNDGRALRNTLSILGFALLFLAIRFCRVDEHYPGTSALFPVLGSVCVIAAGPLAWLNRLVLSNKLAVGVGLISYPLYLWHWPILSYFHILGWEASGGWTWRLIRLGCILAAILLAFLTYKYIETPVRFKIKRSFKNVAILVLSMGFIGAVGGYICLNHGFTGRSNMMQYQKIHDGAASGRGPFFSNDVMVAKEYAAKLDHGRYRSANSDITVAVIGDSHAESAYYGIAEINKKIGINTFWMPYRHTTSLESRENVFQLLKEKKDIKYVVIFLRGVLYLTANDIDEKNRKDILLADKFKPFLQDTIDALLAMNKQVFLVSENPALPYTPRYYIKRPGGYRNMENKPLPPTRQEVLEHQRDYLALLDELHGATIINSLDAFCPKDRCLDVLSDGQVLYYDDDHLSVSGSLFQARELLLPYLEQIAKEARAAN